MGSTSAVLPSMPLLLSWRLCLTLRRWLRACSGKRWVPPLTPAPLWLSSLLLHPDQTGSVWRTLMCHFTSTHCRSPSMRPCTSTSSQQLPPPVPVPWPSRLPCLRPVTGSMAFHLPRWVSTFWTRSSDAVYATGWECPFTAPPTPALNATTQLTLLVTTRSAVEATGIG